MSIGEILRKKDPIQYSATYSPTWKRGAFNKMLYRMGVYTVVRKSIELLTGGLAMVLIPAFCIGAVVLPFLAFGATLTQGWYHGLESTLAEKILAGLVLAFFVPLLIYKIPDKILNTLRIWEMYAAGHSDETILGLPSQLAKFRRID